MNSTNKNTETETFSLSKDQGKDISDQLESHVSANFLCNFMRKADYLMDDIRDMCLRPRYYEESIGYLGIPGFPILTFPMLCFCDIPLSKVDIHMHGVIGKYKGYGDYGIALNKKYCRQRDVQPITYLNPNSQLSKDMTATFQLLMSNGVDVPEDLELLSDLLMRDLMYTKPIEGDMKRADGSVEHHLFKDECEWRYIPQIPYDSTLPLFLDEKHTTNEGLDTYSKALQNLEGVNFTFSTDDIIYLIVPDEKAALDLIEYISALNDRSQIDKNKLISKIEIADRFNKNLV